MSGSWWSSDAGRPHASHAVGPSISAETVTWPSGQYHAGIRWPHHSWRETFQSRIVVSQCSHVFSKTGGTILVRPPLVASRAAAAGGAGRMNHRVFRGGPVTPSGRRAPPAALSVGWSAA